MWKLKCQNYNNIALQTTSVAKPSSVISFNFLANLSLFILTI